MTQNTSLDGALILGAGYTGLGVIRSLGRHKIPTWLIGPGLSIAGTSRFTRKAFPMPGTNEDQQVDFLLELARRNNLMGWSLFPESDRSAGMISRNRKSLEPQYKISVPGWDVLEWAFNKQKTYQLADEVGVKHPRTIYPANRQDVENLDGEFPMILKPIHHQGEDLFSIGRAWKGKNKQEILNLYDRACSLADPRIIMIQEQIPAKSHSQLSFAALCQDGKIVVSGAAERKRLLPADFGVGVYIETVENPEIGPLAQRWLEKIR